MCIYIYIYTNESIYFYMQAGPTGRQGSSTAASRIALQSILEHPPETLDA